MPDPVACNPGFPIRPELLDPDVVVDLAARLAKVEPNCAPVDTLGPSFEQLRSEQKSGVANPVAALVKGATRMDGMDLALKAFMVARWSAGWMGRAMIVEEALMFFVSTAIAEGEALNEARIRDAKVLVFLTLASDALPSGFLAGASGTRQSGRGEALRILSQIDAQPGLRDTLARDIRRGIDEGRALSEAFDLASAPELTEFLGHAAELSDEQKAGVALSDAELTQLDFAKRFAGDTAFRIGVYARIWSEQQPAP